MTATALFWVVIGGALSATLRYAVAVLIGSEAFPWATILSNIAGSLIIGVIWGACADQAWFQGWGRLFLVVGLLGVLPPIRPLPWRRCFCCNQIESLWRPYTAWQP